MDHNVIRFPIYFEIIEGPIGPNFSRIIDHQLVIRILPIMLIGPFGTPIDNPPVWWGLNMQLDGVRLMADDIHEDLATRVVGMASVELGVRPGKVIPEHPIS